MAEFAATNFSAVRLSDDSQKVTIAFSGNGDQALEVTLPVADLPELVLYLSRAAARHHADLSGFPVMAYTLPVHGVEVVNLSSTDAVAMVLVLREGLQVPFSVPRAMCGELASRFAGVAGTA